MRTIAKRISYGKNRIKDLKELVKFENSLNGKSYTMFSQVKEENGETYLRVIYRIND